MISIEGSLSIPTLDTFKVVMNMGRLRGGMEGSILERRRSVLALSLRSLVPRGLEKLTLISGATYQVGSHPSSSCQACSGHFAKKPFGPEKVVLAFPDVNVFWKAITESQ
jgi:hypothetical protein